MYRKASETWIPPKGVNSLECGCHTLFTSKTSLDQSEFLTHDTRDIGELDHSLMKVVLCMLASLALIQ